MRWVYLAQRAVQYEGVTTLSVHATLEGAKAAVDAAAAERFEWLGEAPGPWYQEDERRSVRREPYSDGTWQVVAVDLLD